MMMDEALKSALQINVQLLRRVAALEIVLAALIRSQPDSIRRTTNDEAQELMAAVVGKMVIAQVSWAGTRFRAVGSGSIYGSTTAL